MSATSLPLEASHARSAAHRNGTAFMGMVMFMASWAMLFSALFFAYALVRQRAPSWPPPDLPILPRALPALATVLLALSSLLLERALRRARRGASGVARPLVGTMVLALGFLTCQVAVWRDLLAAGLAPRTGTYASVFYTLTVFHALHVVVGLVALGFLSVQAHRGAYTRDRHIPLRLWTMYWHMVGVIWGAMFVAIYLI